MISDGWTVPVDDATLSDTKCCYFSVFITKQDKAKVVFTGSLLLKERH